MTWQIFYNLPSNRHQQYPVRNILSKTNMLYHEFVNSIRLIDAFRRFANPRKRNPVKEIYNKNKISNKWTSNKTEALKNKIKTHIQMNINFHKFNWKIGLLFIKYVQKNKKLRSKRIALLLQLIIFYFRNKIDCNCAGIGMNTTWTSLSLGLCLSLFTRVDDSQAKYGRCVILLKWMNTYLIEENGKMRMILIKENKNT